MCSTKKYLWNNLETCRLIPCNTSFQKKKIYIDILDKLHKKITIRRNEDDWKSIVASSYHPIFIRVSHILLIHFHSCIEFVLNILTTQTWYIGDFFPLFSLAKLCVRKKKKFLCGRQRMTTKNVSTLHKENETGWRWRWKPAIHFPPHFMWHLKAKLKRPKLLALTSKRIAVALFFISIFFFVGCFDAQYVRVNFLLQNRV